MMKRDWPFNLFAWCFVVFIAAFMPWGIAGIAPVPFFGGTLTQTATGWKGNISLLEVLIPNWIVAIIAVAIAVVAWLRLSAVDIKPRLSVLLALYGVFHAVVFIVGITSRGYDNPAKLGIGSILTLVGFIGILLSLRKFKVASQVNE